MKTLISILLLLTSITASAQSTIEVWVPAGDVGALKLAMEEAAARDPGTETTILSAGGFDFTDITSGLPEITTNVVIEGRYEPIIFSGAGEQFANLFLVQPGGRLRLQNIKLRDFSLGLDRAILETYTDQNLIINRGVLELSQVQIDSLQARSESNRLFRILYAPIIKNTATGQLHLDQVSLIDSGTRLDGGIILNDGIVAMQNTQVYFSPEASFSTFLATPFRNNRFMSMKNVSMFNNIGTFSAVSTIPGAETYIGNSVFSGFWGFCENAISTGHNLIDGDGCNFNAEGDVMGEPTGLSWRPVETRCYEGCWSNSKIPSILSHALVPFASSLAVDSIDPENCPSGDLLGSRNTRPRDGKGDGVTGCDKGAVELVPSYLTEGGINGVYFNPDADGHYISIIDNPYNTLIMWNSFDQDGNQYFVHGTGELVQGRSLIADAYINVSGSTSPEGDIVPAQELHWGTLEVDMTSCNEGTLAFSSDFPEIGNGQVRLQRLVYVKQLGCVD